MASSTIPTPPSRTSDPPASSGATSGQSVDNAAAKSDLGTILLHWTVTISMIASLLTGLRISADAEGSVFAKAIQSILPQGEIWTVHFLAAVTLTGAIFAYPLYMSFAGLRRRAALAKVAVLTLPASRKMKWGAFNVALHWVLFLAVIVLAATGIALYFGYGGWVVTVHYVTALVALVYIFIHVFSHYMYGGLWQLLRLFRPTPLVEAKFRRPILAAVGIGVVLAALFAGGDYFSRDVLVVPTVKTAPAIEGRLDDAIWKEARPVFVDTIQGAHPSNGRSRVEIRAVKDAERIYFAFRWEDPTRTLKRLPLIKREDGWHLLHNKADKVDESLFYEDKFAIMFSASDAFGSGGSTHLGPNPLAGKPVPMNGRGYHYTTDGSLIDVWQWKATRGGQLGYMDDLWFGTPTQPSPDMAKGLIRYQAGYDADAGHAFYSYNYVVEPPGGFQGAVKIKRLPKDAAAVTARLTPLNLDPDKSDPEGQQWWMLDADSEPYSAEKDATIPVGTVIPSTLIAGPYDGSRADIKAFARWSDGHWTLMASRALDTKQPDDAVMRSGLFMWVAVFDHNQTRHTRHMRPVRLELR